MNSIFTRMSFRNVITLACLQLSAAGVVGQEATSDSLSKLQFWADAKVVSFRPGETLTTYRRQPSGGVGPGGTLTLGARDGGRHFDVKIVGKLKSQRFIANVSVKPTEEDKKGTKAQEIEYDLSDLAQRMLEIARDDDGRLIQLSLVPSIRDVPQPRQFKAANLGLENWTFAASPVILNDQDYLGQFSMSSSPVAHCDIPGLAKIEFSLFHLKDAQPLGTLERGVVTIRHENGTTLRISDVKNGGNPEVLRGGPYKVWVRWLKPSETIEEYRESTKKHLSLLKERIKDGELAISAKRLEQLEKMTESGRIEVSEFGARGLEDDEVVEDK